MRSFSEEGFIGIKGINLKVLQPSRRRIKAGDIFVMQPADSLFVFGRVIRTGARVGSMEGAILIYIYKASSDDKNKVPSLEKENLLLPPMLISRSPWSGGYFETIENRPLEEEDALPVHCFESISEPPTYHDDYARELPGKVEPCGGLSLWLDLGISICVCEALGIPVVEREE